MKKKNGELQQNIIHLERKSRKNNIIIFGIENEEQNLFDCTINIFRNILELEIEATDLNDVYRISTKNSEKYPVAVEFLSFQKKQLVLKHANKLKGKNIYIARDQCKEDRQNSRTLLNHQKRARAKGKSAYIKRGKLYIDEEEYTLKQLEEQNEGDEINIEHIEREEIIEEIVPTIGKKRQLKDFEVHKTEERDKKKVRPGQSKEQKTKEGITDRVQTRSK